MKKQHLLLLILTLSSVVLFAQKSKQTPPSVPIDLNKIKVPQPSTNDSPQPADNLDVVTDGLKLPDVQLIPINLPAGLKIETSRNGLPTMISGSMRQSTATTTTSQMRTANYLDAVKTVMHIKSPGDEFIVRKTETDDLGQTHTRLQQQFKGIPVWNGEVVLHEENQKIKLMNGAYYPTPVIENIEPTVDVDAAAQTVRIHLANNGGFLLLNDKAVKQVGGQQIKSELVIYHMKNNANAERLAWHITAYSSVLHRYEYFVDAQTNAVLNNYESSCTFAGHFHKEGEKEMGKSDASTLLKEQESVVELQPSAINPQPSTIEMPPLDGPATANAKDLLGVTRTINTYSTSGTYVLIDASRPMFKAAQSTFPNSPVGVLQIWDNLNNDGGGKFDFTQSPNNNWSANPLGVSAQFNGATAYLYYLNTHGRNSINGKGGNVDSYINVADKGSAMDNAYWNGEAMYYGNGNKYFYPLAQGLDVAGHEISHGVIQNTANLEYQDESGALNESMADVFGSFIDRANWSIGENVIKNKNAFPTGFLRDLANPHNGGTRLGDGGYQPAVYSEIYTGSQDNGGVHINSGIPNYAYYLFASNSAVGKDKAEKIYYRALVNYLVASSNFIDCRAAIEQCCKDLYPNDANILAAASNAFAQVGIGAGGSATGATHQTDLPVNTGSDFVLFVGATNTGIYVQTPGGQPQAITNNKIKSKPSISDNGTAVTYVGDDTKLYYISINWSTGAVKEQEIGGGQTGWNNTAISRDGNKIAANAGDTLIYVINLKTAKSQVFGIYNPTTASGITTSDVQYSDALEWDLFGEKIIYDAYNAPSGLGALFGTAYWDIGIINVWSNSTGNFYTGRKVQKVFTELPEKTSVGNPTFAKNSPYIIAFDYLEQPDANTTNYYVVSANIQTGDVTQNPNGLIKNNTLGFPNFSIKDDKVLFTTGTGSNLSLQAIGVTSTKLEPTGGAVSVQASGQKGSFFTNTSRIISATTDLDKSAVRISPNPFTNQLQVELTASEVTDSELNVFDLLGRQIMTQKFRTQMGVNTINLDTQNFSAGMYFLKARMGNGILTVPVVKN